MVQFIVSISLFSLPRTEPSITRSPARRTSPPINDLSTMVFSFTSRFRRCFNAAASLVFAVSSMVKAEITSTSTVFSCSAFNISKMAEISASSGNRLLAARFRTSQSALVHARPYFALERPDIQQLSRPLSSCQASPTWTTKILNGRPELQFQMQLARTALPMW